METDQQSHDVDRRLLVALLGLSGEVGTLLTRHKKWLRDGDTFDRRAGVTEDVGDILWYLAASASALGVSLDDAATANLAKVVDRWPAVGGIPGGDDSVQLPAARVFDVGLRPEQRLPRRLVVALAPVPTDPSRVIGIIEGGGALGNLVGDNAYTDDGYRWHDAIHLSHLAVLGWSPVIRALLKRKRKDLPAVDDVEDGGRAIVIEEGIAASVFDYASHNAWLERVTTVDTQLLTGLRSITRGLEIRAITLREWEQTILRAFECWRGLREDNGGMITLDLDQRTIVRRALTPEERSAHNAAAVKEIEDGLK